MRFGSLSLVFLVNYLKFIAVTGELVLERSPACPGDPIVFRCSVSSGRLEWTWSVFPLQQFILIPGVTTPGVRNFPFGNTPWTFNATNISASFINVIATIMEPLNINGTTTTCNGQMLLINSAPSDLRPKFLTINRNRSEVNLYPNIKGDINRVDYQLSEGSRMVVTQPISVKALENITFFHCLENITFAINADCLSEDNNDGLNYTLFSNETWEISRICGNVQVTCNNGNWSEDISCPELISSTNLIQTDSIVTEGIIATNEDKITTSTKKEEENNVRNERSIVKIFCPGCISVTVPQIIGGVIGTFLLAFVVGNTLGVLCGIKYARRSPSERKSEEKFVISTDSRDLSTGPLYEDIKVQKDVELQPNISYETVNKVVSS